MITKSPQLNSLHNLHLIHIQQIYINIIHTISNGYNHNGYHQVGYKCDYNQHSGGYKREDRKHNIKQKEEVTETVVEEGNVDDMPVPNKVDEDK